MNSNARSYKNLLTFNVKQGFNTLIRLIGSAEHAAGAIYGLFREFNWHRVSWLFHNHNENAGRGNSDCAFAMTAIQKHFSNNVAKQTDFDENESTRRSYRKMLTDIKSVSRSELNGLSAKYNLLSCFDSAGCDKYRS